MSSSVAIAPGRVGLALSVAQAPFAMGGPRAIEHVLEDLGFVNPVVWESGATLPANAVAMLRGKQRSFPQWLTYAEATWPRARAELNAAADLFEILACESVGAVAADDAPPLPWRPLSSGVMVAAFAAVAIFVGVVAYELGESIR